MTDIERAVLAADDARRACILRGDAAGLAAMLTDDLVYTHSTGKSDTKDAYLAPLQAGTTIYRRMDRSEAVVQPVTLGVARLHGRLMMDIVRAGVERTLDLRFLSVWVEDFRGWRMAACHTTAIAPPRSG
jgi:ketosteroid isomerase-like protein